MISKLKIFGFIYTIKTEFDRGNVDGLAGQCNAIKTEITISTAMNSKPHQKSVLIHEIIEAINYHLELKLDHTAITGLETGLYQVIVDNPELLEYLKSEKDSLET